MRTVLILSILLLHSVVQAEGFNPFVLQPKTEEVCAYCWDNVNIINMEEVQALAYKEIKWPEPKMWANGTHRQVLVWSTTRTNWAPIEVKDDLLENGWGIGLGEHIQWMSNPEDYGLEAPAYVVVDEDGPIRQFKKGCGMQLDSWAFYWLATGQYKDRIATEEVKVKSTGKYPVRGAWWSIEGHWNVSKDFLIRHLRKGGEHRGKVFQGWSLEQLSYEELQSIHSDDHENRMKPLRNVAKKKVAGRGMTFCPT